MTDPSHIPRVIHQIWYQGAHHVPARYRRFADHWRRLHPGWEYRLWDHAACRALLAARYPDYLALWDGYPLDIQRIDAIRYFILHAHGGIYLDMDIECLKPIDPLIDGHALLLSRTVLFNNAVMASRAGHALWDAVFPVLVARMRTHHRPRGVLGRIIGDGRYIVETAGPAVLSHVIDRTGADRAPGTSTTASSTARTPRSRTRSTTRPAAGGRRGCACSPPSIERGFESSRGSRADQRRANAASDWRSRS
jgi:mannosyltransferase OCH1-like enzyme